MAKNTKEINEKKREHAKTLYVKGFSLETIASIIDMSLFTVKKWAKADNFEAIRKSSALSLSEMQRCILDSFATLKEGGKPTIKPDEAAKYASAFEKLSDKKKSIPYFFEAYEALTDAMTQRIEDAKVAKDKEKYLAELKLVRQITTDILNNLINESNNE